MPLLPMRDVMIARICMWGSGMALGSVAWSITGGAWIPYLTIMGLAFAFAVSVGVIFDQDMR